MGAIACPIGPAARPHLFLLQQRRQCSLPRVLEEPSQPQQPAKDSQLPQHSPSPARLVPLRDAAGSCLPQRPPPPPPRCRYLMEARCLIATSSAWTDSKGTGICPLTKASWSMRQLTMAIHLIETLNILSLPSPGIVTSKSTWGGKGSDHGIATGLQGHSTRRHRLFLVGWG